MFGASFQTICFQKTKYIQPGQYIENNRIAANQKAKPKRNCVDRREILDAIHAGLETSTRLSISEGLVQAMGTVKTSA
jgi:hypothetical protein